MKSKPHFDRPHHDQPLEFHIHGDIQIRPDVTSEEVDAAIEPLYAYTAAHWKAQGRRSLHPDDGGIELSRPENVLRICWTVAAAEDLRETIEETIMGLNEVAAEGATLEISVYDVALEERAEDERDSSDDAHDDDDDDDQSRDDFFVRFVGPTPAAIMKVQRDLLVRDVTMLMERHFERNEMSPVIDAIDDMWVRRYKAIVDSMGVSGSAKRGRSGGHTARGAKSSSQASSPSSSRRLR